MKKLLKRNPSVSLLLHVVLLLFTLLLITSGQPVAAQTDTSSPAGRWYINASSQRLNFRFDLINGVWLGARLDGQGAVIERFTNVTWDVVTRTLEFRRQAEGGWLWYRGKIVEGVLAGRYAQNQAADKPGDPLAYKWRLTGWNYEYLTPALAPLVFDIEVIQTAKRARLRIDRSSKAPSGFEGRLKFYAQREACQEGLEEDFNIERWDGVSIKFTIRGQTYEGVVNGRLISGTLKQGPTAATHQWRGERAEVLTYGFAEKLPAARTVWQKRTRNQLYHLALAGNPEPLSREVKELTGPMPPLLGMPVNRRDDNHRAYPQNYTVTELSFRYTLPNPFGGPLMERLGHGFLAKPTTPPISSTRGQKKYPLVITLNGHSGSAWQTLHPGSENFWYGDAYARQGYMVLAVDISHRPLFDLIYSGNSLANSLGYTSLVLTGDDVEHGNLLHPSIKPALPPSVAEPQYYTDWEEDGERAWDVMRALDYALARPDVDPQRIVVTGLSMGGEVAAYVAALDPRITVAVPAGFSPDLNVLKYNGSHGCWHWHYSDIREYFDSSDLFALVAPRPMIIQTGKLDAVYSCYPIPFAADKQVARRVRAAYGTEVGYFIHYLHYDEHAYHVGDLSAFAAEQGVRQPLRIGPAYAGDVSWQTDGTTYSATPWNLFRYVGSWLGIKFLR